MACGISGALPEPLGKQYQPRKLLQQRPGKETWLAQDQISGQTVVIKLLYFNAGLDWQQVRLFEREAQVLRSLTHPNIPQYLGYLDFQDDHRQGLGLIQSYVEGDSLAKQLRQGRSFTEADLQQLARALLQILSFLHGRQPPVLHRDLKPSNIIVANRSAHSLGNVFLVDFDAVQTALAPEGATRTIVGTYGYMPPEQFGGRTVPASDLYSLGATLIAIATGQHPADLPQEMLKLQFESRVSLSPAMTRWIGKLVEPSLALRFASAQAAITGLDQLETFEQPTPPLVQPQQSRVRLTKQPDRLHIQIPPPGFHAGLVLLLPFAIAWNSFVAFWTFSAAFTLFPVNLVFLLFSLPFWAVGLAMAGGILLALFGKVQLEINPRQLIYTVTLFGIPCRWPAPSKLEEIDQVEWVPRHWTKDSDGDRVEVPARLTLYAGRKQYRLGGALQLQEAEMRWLAQEISDWLGLPLTSAPA